jgi:hypothetical protein
MRLPMMVSAIGCMLGALGVLAYQVFRYVKDGVWTAFSVLDTLKQAGIEWAFRPTDWYALHQSLDWTPLSAGLFVLGVIALNIGVVLPD